MSAVLAQRLSAVLTCYFYKHSIYPGIDPAPHFANKTYAGKVVLVTGASRGLGASAASLYARAGASVTIVARSADSLEEVRAAIVKETPGAQVLTFVVDVKDPAAAEHAVEETVKQYGKLDVLIANAGTCLPFEKRNYTWPMLAGRYANMTPRDQASATATIRWPGGTPSRSARLASTSVDLILTGSAG